MATASTPLTSSRVPQRADEWLASPASDRKPAEENDERTGRCVPPGWRRQAPAGSWRLGAFDDAF